MNNFITNLRIYGKFLSRNKLYTIVSVLGFSISLMFVILIGTYVRQELSFDSFHEKKDRIFVMASEGKTYASLPIGQYVKDKCPEVEDFARVTSKHLPIRINAQQSVSATVLLTDSSFFDIFSFPLFLGEKTGIFTTTNSIILSKQMTNTLFENENPIGKPVNINGVDLIVSGVMEDFPYNSHFTQPDVLLNIEIISEEERNSFGGAPASVFFLQKEGSDLSTKAPMLLEAFKKDYPIYTVGVLKDVEFIPIQEAYLSVTATSVDLLRTNSLNQVQVYLSITFIILIIALLNYVNMTTAQATTRGKESAIKKLLGASQSSIVWQQILESTLMVGISFLIGLAFAFVCEEYFNTALNTQLHLSEVFNLSSLLVIIPFIVFIGLVSSMIPSRLMTSFQPIEVVKGSYTRKVKSTYSQVLIIFQYAVAIIFIIASLLITKQINFMKNVDLPYDKEHTIILDNTESPDRIEGLRSELKKIAGVEVVSFSIGAPLKGASANAFKYKEEMINYYSYVADKDFFEVYNIQIEPTGVAEGYDTYYFNKQALKAFPFGDSYTYTLEDNMGELKIVGIIDDFEVTSMHRAYGAVWIQPLNPNVTPDNISIKLAANIDVMQTVDKIKETYSSYNGGISYKVDFIDDILGRMYKNEAQTSQILSAFSIFTIIITIMGVFAMSIYLVQQKEKEMAIRKVNGATSGMVLWIFNTDSIKRILIAFVIACPVAYYAVNKWLESYAYKTSITPLAFIVAGLSVTALSLLSVNWIAWRSASSNPIDILKKGE